MTREEFYEKYGGMELKFVSYYKYIFTFSGLTDEGYDISCGCGGNSEDIYRMEVATNSVETVAELQPFMGSIYKDGVEIEGFYDY